MTCKTFATQKLRINRNTTGNACFPPNRSRSTTPAVSPKPRTATALTETSHLRHTMKVAFTIASVLCCITTVSATMPWGFPGRRVAGTVKTGSAEESLHAADLTKCTVEDEGTTLRGGDSIPPSNSTVGDDGTIVRDRSDISPSNTPPSKKHPHHRGGSPMSSFAENGLTNFGCCVADGLDSAAERMANGVDSAAERMANARVEASVNIRKGMGEASMTASENIRKEMEEGSMNIRKGMGEASMTASENIRNVTASENIRKGMEEGSMNIRKGIGEASMTASENIRNVTASENILNGMGEASMNIRNGMVAVGVCMVVSSSGVCLVAISLLGRSK